MLACIIMVYAITMHVKNDNKLLTFFMLQIVRSSDLHLLPPSAGIFPKMLQEKTTTFLNTRPFSVLHSPRKNQALQI